MSTAIKSGSKPAPFKAALLRPLILAALIAPEIFAHRADASPWFPDTHLTPPLPSNEAILDGIELAPFTLAIHDAQGDSRRLLLASDNGIWVVDRNRPGHMEMLSSTAPVFAATFIGGRAVAGGAPGLDVDSAAALPADDTILQIVPARQGGVWALTDHRVLYGTDPKNIEPVLTIESGIAGRAALLPDALAVPGLNALWIVKPDGASARIGYTPDMEGDVILAALSSGPRLWIIGKYAGVSAMRDDRGGFEPPVAPAPLLDDVHSAGPFSSGWSSAFFGPGDGLILLSGAGQAWRVRFGRPMDMLASWPPLHETHHALELADRSLAVFPASGNHLYIVNPGESGDAVWERINFVRSTHDGTHHHLAGLPPHPYLPALIGPPAPWWRRTWLIAGLPAVIGLLLFHFAGLPRLRRMHPDAERFGHQLEEWMRSYHALRRSKERSGMEWSRVSERLAHASVNPLTDEFRLNYEERKRTLSQGINDVDTDLDRLLAAVSENSDRIGHDVSRIDGRNGAGRGLFNRYLESNWRRAYRGLARQIHDLRARDVMSESRS